MSSAAIVRRLPSEPGRTALSRRRRRWIVVGVGVAIALLAAIAWWRGGLLGLPDIPNDIGVESTGLGSWSALGERSRRLEAGQVDGDPALTLAATALRELQRGELATGLESFRAALAEAPDDLVLGNAFRMAVFRARRRALADGAARTTLAAQMPPALDGEPLRSLAAHAAAHPRREAQLQLALAWVDEMLLFPALEIKAPASVQSVEILSALLASEPNYVPALFGRGLNYLHRPARLVWPEADKMAPDAASRDLARAVAIGRQVGGASPQLVATLSMALGDAYAKEGRAERARSWWQIAANACREPEVRAAVNRRLGWQDGELLDRLEAELEGRMLDRDHPLTDLERLWR